jgi:hypothetical protein
MASSSRSTILATNRDIGSANAMIPALKVLQEKRWNVITLAQRTTPAFEAFQRAGLNPMSRTECGEEKAITAPSMNRVLNTEKPDVVFVGISSLEETSEKTALAAAVEKKIPTAVIIETWPHLWLANFGRRDFHLYRQASKILAFDARAKEKLVETGFEEKQIEVTGNPSNDVLQRLKQYKARIRRAFRMQFAISESALVLTYAITSSLQEGQLDIPRDDPRWLGFRESENVREFLKAAKQVQAILRIKPGRDSAPFQELAREYCPTARVIGSECKDGRNVILGSDVVIGTTTTMLQIASFLGVLAISYMPRLCRPDPQIANTLSVVKPLYGNGELHEVICQLIQSPELIGTLKGKCVQVDIPGNASERVAEALEALAQT